VLDCCQAWHWSSEPWLVSFYFSLV